MRKAGHRVPPFVKMETICKFNWANLIRILLSAGFVTMSACSTAQQAPSSPPTVTLTFSQSFSTMAARYTPPSIVATPTLAKPEPSNDRFKGWLKGIPCQLPCWEGITPGKTTGKEAAELLNDSPLVSSISSHEYTDRATISWVWNLSGRSSGGMVTYDKNSASDKVTSISFVTYPSFRDIIEEFGEPSHIIAGTSRSPYENKVYAASTIVYLSKGLAISTGHKELSGSTLIRDVTFFPPNIEGLIKAGWISLKSHPENLTPWQGFKGFDFYCHDESKGDDCRQAESSLY